MKNCISTKFFAVFSSCLIFVVLTGCNPSPSGQLNTNTQPTVSITNSNTISKKSEQNSNNRTVNPSPQQNNSSTIDSPTYNTKAMTKTEIEDIFANSPNPVAAEIAYDAALGGQEITIKSFEVYALGRNNVGTVYMANMDINMPNPDFNTFKHPLLLVLFSESKKESLSSIKRGDIVNVRCRYLRFEQIQTDGGYRIVFDFESF